MSTTSLPQGFEALEPFVEFWGGDTMADRARARDESDAASRQAFYDVAKPLVPQALEHLDQKSLDSLDEAEQRLLKVALSFGHVAMAVELQREEEPNHARWRHFMRITTSPTDMARS